jgi:hypothetical protein
MHWTKVRVFFYKKKLSSNQSVLLFYFFLCFDRFFETEGIAVLAILVSQYKIAIQEEPQFVG